MTLGFFKLLNFFVLENKCEMQGCILTDVSFYNCSLITVFIAYAAAVLIESNVLQVFAQMNRKTNKAKIAKTCLAKDGQANE